MEEIDFYLWGGGARFYSFFLTIFWSTLLLYLSECNSSFSLVQKSFILFCTLTSLLMLRSSTNNWSLMKGLLKLFNTIVLWWSERFSGRLERIFLIGHPRIRSDQLESPLNPLVPYCCYARRDSWWEIFPPSLPQIPRGHKKGHICQHFNCTIYTCSLKKTSKKKEARQTFWSSNTRSRRCKTRSFVLSCFKSRQKIRTTVAAYIYLCSYIYIFIYDCKHIYIYRPGCKFLNKQV